MKPIVYLGFFLSLIGFLQAQEIKQLKNDLNKIVGNINEVLPKLAFFELELGRVKGEIAEAEKVLKDLQFDEKGEPKTITLSQGQTREGYLKPYTDKLNAAQAKEAAPSKSVEDFLEKLKQPYEELSEITEQLVKQNTKEAVQALEEVLVKTEKGSKFHNDMYLILGKGVASFTNRDAMNEVGDFILKNKSMPIAQDVLFFMVQGNFHTNAEEMVIEIFQKGPPVLRDMAIGYMKLIRSKKTIPVLIEALKKEDKASGLQEKLMDALEAITGGTGNNAEQWASWWSRNQGEELHELRKKRMSATSGWRDNDLEKIRDKKILVITSFCTGEQKSDHNFDHIEDILVKTWKMNEEVIHIVRKEDFVKEDLSNVLAILINCNLYWRHDTAKSCRASGGPGGIRLSGCGGPGPHNPMTHELSPEACAKIKKYVENGGYLFTEDWVLEELLEVNWPKLIWSTRRTSIKPTEGKEEKSRGGLKHYGIEVFITRGAASHPYLRGVWGNTLKEDMSTEAQNSQAESRVYEPAKHGWIVDDDSPIVEVNLQNCQVLIETKDARLVKDGNGGSVAVVFSPVPDKQVVITGEGIDPGKMKGGRVLHVLSHFDEQKGGDRS
ncbi:MAG: hypothetical protein AABZ60_06305, partial [Planctomycetota bacterium]